MKSIWQQTARLSARPPLTGEHRVEVAVVGGGLTGILTAARLAEAGVEVAVVEAGRVGSGQTGGTTAKVTAQHGLIYSRLERERGPEAARQYAQAALDALAAYQRLVDERGVRCGWERLPFFLYTTTHTQALEEEAQAAGRAGLDAALTDDAGLPFPISGALRLPEQAQMHPLALLFSLAENLTIFEGSRVLEAEGDQLRTGEGVVRAQHILFTCHFPFVNIPGFYFARMHQERSYVLALANAHKLEGMYAGANRGELALRRYGDLLLLSGAGHRTGENREGGRYEALERSAALLFPGARAVGRWSAQDCMTADGVPYIGPFSPTQPRWSVATGFGKWGMTSAMAAALLLQGQLLGQKPAWAEVFSPRRFTPAAVGNLARDALHAAKGLTRQWAAPPRSIVETLPPGHGGVVALAGRKTGIYKSPGGAVTAVDVRCPHMGCQLEWNGDEASWDCPCHGSRFDCRGRLLSGPAQRDLDAAGPET